ncbi:STX18 [Phaffia rhodozyma]|uniref:STX18 n=1 Tax=Phaffia rhodozyma TaxID=264483 RepID=A0A0F7SJW9_PHARH|nr:STX18 [Phaffia rhodozyma]
MAIDNTSAFRKLYSERVSSITTDEPDRSSASSSKTGLRRGQNQRQGRGGSVDTDDGKDEFLAEAYRIHHHLQGLLTSLSAIKRQYLSISSSSSNPMASSGLKGKSRENVSNSTKIFGETEREEFDLQAKILLKRCLERVLSLEKAEEQTGGLFKKGKSREFDLDEVPTSTRLLSLILPPSMVPNMTSSSSSFKILIAAHHSSILFYLHASLSKAGQALSDLQEERVRRLTEAESRSLGGGLSILRDQYKSSSNPDADKTGENSSTTTTKMMAGLGIPEAPVVKREGESELTREQIQLFESENEQMMKTYDSHLEEIQKTQKTLSQISTLQSLLSQSLMQQAETSDRLLLEAGQTVSDVKAGNEQLRKAQERSGSGRIMLLTFLIGASLALLFLDWYS